MQYLLIHGHQFDPALNTWPKQWVVEELDRISNSVDWGPFNRLRAKASTVSQTNAALMRGSGQARISHDLRA